MQSFLRLLLVALLLAGCATQPPGRAPQTVLLVSVDGLRPTDVTAAQMPALHALGEAGVRADGMRPSYPSLTFPNHYTLVTGLRPDRHGITHNSMSDARLGRFRLSDRAAVGNGDWWGGVPVWVSAERAGIRSATMFWPGSEAAIHGVQPWQWREYRDGIAPAQSVAQVMQWLRAPVAQRPRFVTLYFSDVDHASHGHGPDSAQAAAARGEVDAAIATLLRELGDAGLAASVNLLVVSDHGFETVPAGQAIATDTMASPDVADTVSEGQVVGFVPKPGREQDAERALLGRHERYACWRRGELPAGWHYGANPRVPPIVCQMAPGWDAMRRSLYDRVRANPAPGPRGSHGYDPDLPQMRATFIAKGPAFRDGVRLPVFDNVDVYPLLMRLLHLPAEPNDGDIAPLLPALREP